MRRDTISVSCVVEGLEGSESVGIDGGRVGGIRVQAVGVVVDIKVVE